MQNLQGLQCSYRRYLNPEDIDPRPYTQLQCSRGYAGKMPGLQTALHIARTSAATVQAVQCKYRRMQWKYAGLL